MGGKKKRGKKKKGLPQASNLPSADAPNSPETSTECPPSFTTTQPSEETPPSTTTKQASDSSPSSPLSDRSPEVQSTTEEAIAEASAASGGAESLDVLVEQINNSALSPDEQGSLLVLLYDERTQERVMTLWRKSTARNRLATMRAFIRASSASDPGEEINSLKQEMARLQVDVADVAMFKKLMADVYAYNEDAVSAVTVKEFRDALVAEYSKKKYRRGDPVIFCMLTQMYLPRKYVISSHLWKRAWHRHTQELMGFDNIHDVRNGLLLFKPIEHAFDTSQLCFLLDAHDNFCAWLLNPALLETLLIDYWLEKEREDGHEEVPKSMLDTVREQIGNMRFGDLHGWWLGTDGPSLPRPFQRVLNYQARMACRHAKDEGWDENRDLPDIPSVKSDFDAERKDRLERFFASIEAEGAAN